MLQHPRVHHMHLQIPFGMLVNFALSILLSFGLMLGVISYCGYFYDGAACVACVVVFMMVYMFVMMIVQLMMLLTRYLMFYGSQWVC